MLGSLLVAMLVTSPLPTYLWGPAALLLAAIPGTVIMNRVRRRAEDRARARARARQEQPPPAKP
jgi:hypothetical protein